MAIQIYSIPDFDSHVNNPEAMNLFAESSCRNLREMISELNKIPDISLRMHRYKRDLIYLSEVAEKEDEMPYCIALAWRMNLGLTKHPDALETPITFSGNLAQRVKDLIRCCDAETLELHPLLKSHLAAAEKQA